MSEVNHNEIYASDENKVAKFTIVQHTGFVIIYKWKCNTQTWLKFGRIVLENCPFFLNRLFEPDKNRREFIGVYTESTGLRSIYEWR